MKRLPFPAIDDIAVLEAISLNTLLGSSSIIRKYLSQIHWSYLHYHNKQGNPWKIVRYETIPSEVKAALICLYNSSPNDLSFLEYLRHKSMPRICCMCGSFGNGTLDHVLPKDHYPQFSIFSKNLVPACNCNSNRKTTTKGMCDNQRILHPYYDNCLKERLFSVLFQGEFFTPNISIELIYPQNMPDFEAVRFHFQNVVLKTNIENWMIQKWADLVRDPFAVIETLNEVFPISKKCLVNAVEKKMVLKDREFKTMNNWDSAFFHGLLNSSIFLERLLIRVNSPRQNTFDAF